MIDRTIPPKIQPISSISLHPPRSCFMNNGVPMFVFDNPQLDLIHFIVQIKTGILYETVKHVAQFAFSLLKESSAKYSSTETADLLDFYGVSYRTSITLDRVTILFSIPKNYLNNILPTITDFIINPVYREENLEKYKRLKIKDLEYNMQKTEVQSTRQMLHTMFGDEVTAGRFSTKENLQAVTTQQMADFHRKMVCAERITLFVTGNMDAENEDFIKAQFTQLPHGAAAEALPKFKLPAINTPKVTLDMPTSVQTSITLCRAMAGYNDEERYDFSILGTILGGYFGSRLMQSLRERHGFTYGISAGSVYFGEQSLFIIDSNVNANDYQAALDACATELELLQREPVPADELENVKNYIIGDLIRDVENSVSYMKKYAYWCYYGLDELEMKRCMESVFNITPDRLMCLAKKHLSYNNYTKIIVGKI